MVITRGGYVDIWHSYWPSSLLFVSTMRSRQLFGYWNSTLNRESPLYVCMPTVSSCRLSLCGSRFTHDTCVSCPWSRWYHRSFSVLVTCAFIIIIIRNGVAGTKHPLTMAIKCTHQSVHVHLIYDGWLRQPACKSARSSVVSKCANNRHVCT